MADVTTTGLGLAGRERVRAEQAAGAEYRTFPARLPAVLGIAAGGFGVLGALGAGLRASAKATARDDPTQVGVLLGYRSGAGWMLAVLALAVAASALAWMGGRRLLKLGAAGIAVAFAALAVLRLSFFDSRGVEWARAARERLDFVGYHAGFGWGGWLLLTAAILAGFAVLVGALRALDLRKGIAG